MTGDSRTDITPMIMRNVYDSVSASIATAQHIMYSHLKVLFVPPINFFFNLKKKAGGGGRENARMVLVENKDENKINAGSGVSSTALNGRRLHSFQTQLLAHKKSVHYFVPNEF